MKAKLAALAAVPLLALSSYSFADDTVPGVQAISSEAMVLSMNQMDEITAGQIIIAPNIGVQLNIATIVSNIFSFGGGPINSTIAATLANVLNQNGFPLLNGAQ